MKSPYIIDICLINKSKNEKCPFGYRMVERSFNHTCWRGGQHLHLCIKYSPSSEGLLQKSYRPVVLDSYFSSSTKKDQQETSTVNMLHHLPLFGFPRGIRLKELQRKERTDKQNKQDKQMPIPYLSTFVLTNENNVTLYGAKLIFYQSVPIKQAFVQSHPQDETECHTGSMNLNRSSKKSSKGDEKKYNLDVVGNTSISWVEPSDLLRPPSPSFISKMHSSLWTGVVRHRIQLAHINRRYCVIDDQGYVYQILAVVCL